MPAMSLLTSQMTSKMSTSYSGLSALIQAATSQLSDLAETSTSETNPPLVSRSLLSNPTTPTLEGADLDLDRTSSSQRNSSGAATVTPVLKSLQHPGLGNPEKLYFPEVLMFLLANPANEDVVTFLPDGKYFAIRILAFSTGLLYTHFQLTSFEDFLEEARGWGFIRVNGNISEDCNSTCGNINNGNCNAAPNSNSNTCNADIYVFRHPHFEKDKRVDMSKIRFRNGDAMKYQKHECFSLGDKSKPRVIPRQKSNCEVNNSKRQLSLSDNHSASADNRQRLRIEAKSSSVDLDPRPLTGNTCDQPAQHLRRQSSLELRGVAQAITASKLHLNHTKEATKEGECNNQDTSMIYDNDDTKHPGGESDQRSSQSTVPSLVDGGVETATQTIVTDAIEALLFDESHTRETYHRHEKELSVSSLPGVVPISKQLFSANENNAASSNTICKSDQPAKARKKTSNGRGKRKVERKVSQSSSSSSSWVINTAIDSLEDASRNNDNNLSTSSFASDSNLRVVIPSHGGGAQHRSMVVSPARMEAAAALVSQSRNTNDEM